VVDTGSGTQLPLLRCGSSPVLLVQEATLIGSSSPQALVSDIRVLDALLGNALRQTDAFLAARGHWVDRKERDSGAQEAAQSRFHPVVLGQSLGPHLGNALHCMWTANARSAPPCAVQVRPSVPVGVLLVAACSSLPRPKPVLRKEDWSCSVKASLGGWGVRKCEGLIVSTSLRLDLQVTSKSTMAKLKGLSRALLMEVFGGVLSEEEIERMLAKRDHLVAYFDGLSRKRGLANVFV